MSSPNIVLFGETGAGKSSVINMIAGCQVARVSPDALGCTSTFCRYSVSVSGRTFHLWDTVGLGEPELNLTDYMDAIHQEINIPSLHQFPDVEAAFTLVQQLAQQGGIDLLLFCICGNRITETTLSNYRLFYEILCRSQVPIALVITHLEQELDLDAWWTRNSSILENYGIRSAGHACVTGLPNDVKYAQSKINVERLLCRYDGQGKYAMPNSWFKRFFMWIASRKKGLNEKKLTKVLMKRCKLDSNIAEELAARLTRPPQL